MRTFVLAALFSACATLANADVINERGAWEGEDVAGHHWHDPALADGLLNFLVQEGAYSVVDFGCGMGDYLKRFIDGGLNASGFDGNPATPQLTKGLAQVLDLSEPAFVGHTFDWVMSLEVGEHLPPQFETTLIENLVRHADKGILLSWAVEGQGGYGHFNCRNNDYVKARLASYGFVNDEEAENRLRDLATLPWFKNTVMVFRKAN